MALFGKKNFGRGSPYILSFFNGFLKEKMAYLSMGWAIKHRQDIFHSNIITKVPPGDIKLQPSQVSSCLKILEIIKPSSYIHTGLQTGGIVL